MFLCHPICWVWLKQSKAAFLNTLVLFLPFCFMLSNIFHSLFYLTPQNDVLREKLKTEYVQFSRGILWLTQGCYGPQPFILIFPFFSSAPQKSPPWLGMGGGTWGPWSPPPSVSRCGYHSPGRAHDLLMTLSSGRY